jgi:hypothetical protein
LTRLGKKKNETIRKFNQRFIKAYKKLPPSTSHGEPLDLDMYIVAFVIDFNFMLNEKNSVELSTAYLLACNLEKRWITAGKSTSFDSQRQKIKEKPPSHDAQRDLTDQLAQLLQKKSF